VSELLARGANATVRNSAGKKAFNLAQESMGVVPSGLPIFRPEAVVKMLEEAAANP
jgi:hypothetical protein